MSYTPKKVFIIENHKYIELTYEEFCELKNANNDFKNKKFIGLHGMIMEVSLSDYINFYKDRRHQKYLSERSKENNDVSFDRLTTDEFNGENILVDTSQDVCDMVINATMSERLHECISFLTEEEQELINTIYFNGMSERDFAKKQGVYHNAIHKRKMRILKKLKKLLEK